MPLVRNGFWNTEQGFEYNLVMVAAAFALAGPWSLDRVLDLDLAGTGWGLAALGAGILGGIGAVVSGRLYARREAREHGAHPSPA